MGDRKQALDIKFTNLGQGQVVRQVPSEDLIQPNPQAVVPSAASPGTINCRLFEGEVVRRAGYIPIGPQFDASTVTRLYWAQFAPRDNYLVQGTARNNVTAVGSLLRWDPGASVWRDFSPVGVSNRPLDSQPWTMAMVPSADPSLPSYMIAGCEASDIYRWNGGAHLAELLSPDAPSGPKILISYLGRAFACNVLAQGERQGRRLQWSVVGDSSDWTGLGSGFIDLDDDPYAIMNARIMGGRLVLFKGGANGGAIYLATPTGSSVAPIRIDAVNPGTNIGVLIPRSVVAINSNLTFFLGHDGAYLYDGVRALLPFATSVSRDIISRVNFDKVDTGWATYRRETREVELHLTMEGAIVPNEMWIFDIPGKRAIGPHSFVHTFSTGTQWLNQNKLTWDTWGQVGTRRWDNLTNSSAQQYFQWTNVVGLADVETGLVYGASTGRSFTSKLSDFGDIAGAINCTYNFPAVTPAGWHVGNPQAPRILREDDTLVLREVVLRHKSAETWVPVVEVSIDGSAWVLVSDGTSFTDTAGRLRTKTYYVPNTLAPASWFQMRVRNTSGDKLSFHSANMRFTYAGSSRHE